MQHIEPQVDFLRQFTKLTYLDILETLMDDTGMSALADLRRLRFPDISGADASSAGELSIILSRLMLVS